MQFVKNKLLNSLSMQFFISFIMRHWCQTKPGAFFLKFFSSLTNGWTPEEKTPDSPVRMLLPVTAKVLLLKASGENSSRSSGFYHQAPKGVTFIHLFFPGPPKPLLLCTGTDKEAGFGVL